MIDVREYGAKLDQRADDWEPIQRALDAGGRVHLPGVARVTRGLRMWQMGTMLSGDGRFTSRLVYDPIAPGAPLLTIERDEPNKRMWFCDVRDVGFSSSKDHGFAKTALLIHDACTFTLRDCMIGPWVGSGSVGIHLRGREHVTIDHIRITADIPIQVSECTRERQTGTDLDHAQLRDLHLIAGEG